MTLRTYLGMWAAIAPAVGLLVLVGYGQEWLHFPLWAAIIAMIATLHLTTAWMLFVIHWIARGEK